MKMLRALALAGCGVVAAPVGAATIAVANPSFEILPAGGLPNLCGAGCSYSEDFIPGWLNTPFAGLGLASGQFRPGTDTGNTSYFDTLSDGPTSAYASVPSIAQTVAATVEEGVTYTLVVDVGYRKDANPVGRPRLEINGVFYDGTGVPVLGGWASFTATYVGLAADVGKPIRIVLTAASAQGNFDNVRLSDSTQVVPVPAAALPFGLALLSLLRGRLRRRAG